MAEKIVLAYSGGLDTSVAVHWLKQEGGYDVIALTVDVGMQRQRADVQSRALTAGPSAAPRRDAHRPGGSTRQDEPQDLAVELRD